MRNTNLFALAAIVGTLITGAAQAEIGASKAAVDAAKSAGVVGEQADGFLGFVKSPDAATKAAAAEINAGRGEVYAQVAAKNGVSTEAAGASAFNHLIAAKLKPGDYYRPEGGGWVRK